MGCCTGLSKCVLLLVNTAIFALAAASLGTYFYQASDLLGRHMVNWGFVHSLLITGIVMMFISLSGCRAALVRPSKRCSRCIYLLVLLAVTAAQIAGAALFFNLGHVLQNAQDRGVDLDNATADVLRYLHDEVGELYTQGSCNGGGANSTTLPVGFADVHCDKDAFDEAFRAILQASTITNKDDLQKFQDCVSLYTASGAQPSAATQAFCASEAHIVQVAQRHVGDLLLLPLCMAVLTLILLIATTVLLCHRSEPARQAEARQPLQEREVRTSGTGTESEESEGIDLAERTA